MTNKKRGGSDHSVPGISTDLTLYPPKRIALRDRLSSKLLLLMILSVFIAEVIIFVPSVANKRQQWLNAVHKMVASSSLLLNDDNFGDPLSQETQETLLRSTGTSAIIIHQGEKTKTLAAIPQPQKVTHYIDLTENNMLHQFNEAISSLLFGGGRVLQISGPAGLSGEIVDIIMNEAPLHSYLVKNARIIAIVSLIISLIAASLIYRIIHVMLLRPVRHMHFNMIEFAQNPEDPSLNIPFTDRKDELGVAQNRLAQIQAHLQSLFHRQKHLADLGLAVSKINHDMRNILASAQLLSDRLEDSKDPVVRSFAPRLIRTLNRAISYAETVITYGRTQELPSERMRIPLHPLVADVAETLAIPAASGIEFRNLVPKDFYADMDQEQMIRVLTNLCRNSVQAMSADLNILSHPAVKGQILLHQDRKTKSLTITAGRIGATAIISVADTGPGLSQKARDNLFKAFHGSTRSDGAGLGLVIAQDLVRAHGGTIELREDYTEGAAFEIRIPDLQSCQLQAMQPASIIA